MATGSMFSSLLRVAEAQIKRRVRTREQEITTTITATSRVTPLPEDFLRQRSLASGAPFERELDYLPPARLRESPFWDNLGSFVEINPQSYTVEGTNLLLAPAPTVDDPAELLFTYVASFAPLVAAADTNWLLEEAYDVYLWGVLAAVAIYLEESELEAKYNDKFETAIADLNTSERRARVPWAAGLRPIASDRSIV